MYPVSGMSIIGTMALLSPKPGMLANLSRRALIWGVAAICSRHAAACGVDRGDPGHDLLQMLIGLALQKGQGQALGPVWCRSAILDQIPAR